jgi:hypothetical protein
MKVGRGVWLVHPFRRSGRTLAAGLALLMVISAANARASGWEVVLEAGDLQVWQRPYAGSSLNEIRGQLVVRSSLNALMALLKDAPFNRQWVYRSGGARILEESGYEQAYVYGIVDAPWPMHDRDTVVRFDYEQHPDTHTITIGITNFPDYLPRKDDFVRVPDFGGFWKLEPREGGWVTVTYQVYGDPGGWIPVWIANRAAEVSVINTLKNLPSVVGRYEGVRSEFVEEPAAN